MKTVRRSAGKTIAIPSRFSDERLILFRALPKHGMTPRATCSMVEMAPPDVAGALAAGAIDAFSMGEPYPSQAEMGGFGRVLFHAREYWPDYISCVLVVRQDVIDDAAGGRAGARRRDRALGTLARQPAAQKRAPRARRRLRRPLLLPPGPEAAALGADQSARPRACTSRSRRCASDFELIVKLMRETGVLERDIAFEEYVDPRFAEGAADADRVAVRAGQRTGGVGSRRRIETPERPGRRASKSWHLYCDCTTQKE